MQYNKRGNKFDAVSITDTNKILAYVGKGEEVFKGNNLQISSITKEAMDNNKILNIKVNKMNSH